MSEVEEAAVKGAIDAAMEDVLEMQIEEEQEEAEAAAEEAAGDGGATDADADGSSGPPSENQKSHNLSQKQKAASAIFGIATCLPLLLKPLRSARSHSILSG